MATDHLGRWGFLLALCALCAVSAACSQSEGPVRAPGVWECTETDTVRWMHPQPAGKTVILIPMSGVRCVQYTRAERGP